MLYWTGYLYIILSFFACNEEAHHYNVVSTIDSVKVTTYPVPGAARLSEYLPQIRGKKLGLVVNHASRVGESHLVDTLLHSKIDIVKIFSPEHGIKGDADAGEHVGDGKHKGIPLLSLYGDRKEMDPRDLKNLEILIFDLQDVGVRFYTYISTLHYVIKACAEADIPLIILDRPNPNGFYIAGPILDTTYQSFVGMHPVPIVYGMTIGEYGQMINGEMWHGKKYAEITVIPCENYYRNSTFPLPEKPSPNLPTHKSILLYPTLCLFEGTVISVGRGTDLPFEVAGHPQLNLPFSFIPQPHEGAKNPKYNGLRCYGLYYGEASVEEIIKNMRYSLEPLRFFYMQYPEKSDFFHNYFIKLAGTTSIKKAIEDNACEKLDWSQDLKDFHQLRKKYLLYRNKP